MLLNNVQKFEFCLFLTCLLLGCNANLETEDEDDYSKNLAVANGAPLISPLVDSLKLEIGSSIILRCEADEPIVWKPTTEEISFEVVPFVPLDLKRPHGVELRLYNVTYKNVGNYFCIKEISVPNVEIIPIENLYELASSFQASYIYIYVNDTEHLLVDIEYPLIQAHQYEDVVLPCKPTMPNIEILLTTPNGTTISSATTSKYDPKQGFIVVFNGITEAGSFRCLPKVPSPSNDFESYDIYVEFIGNENNDHISGITPSSELSIVVATDSIINHNSHADGEDRYRRSLNDGERETSNTNQKYEALTKIMSLPATVKSKLNYISSPEIKSTALGHVYENGTFELSCSVKMDIDVVFEINWYTPITVDESRLNKTVTTKGTDGIGQSNLTVRNAKLTDSGQYKCEVVDHSKNKAHRIYDMLVLKPNSSYINMSEPNNYYNIADKANRNIIINVRFTGYPPPTLKWYTPGGELISPSQKYSIDTKDTVSSLHIKSAQLIDSGKYTVEAANGVVRKNLKFNVTISDAPSATVQDVYVQEGQEAEVICHIIANPKPQVEWTFTPCAIQPRWPACEKNHEEVLNTTSTEKGPRSFDYKHYLRFTPTKPGEIRCIAKNTVGIGKVGAAHVLLGDISDNMTVYGVDENKKIARGDEVHITCAALAYFYTGDLSWFKDGELVQSNNDLELSTVYSSYSYKTSIRFKSINNIDRGSYECRAWSIRDPDVKTSKFIDIFVHEPSVPVMTQSNLNSDSPFEVKLGSRLELECKATAIPHAHVLWYRDDVKVNCNETENIDIIEENTKLIIKHILPGDEGFYKCIASNRLGEIEASRSIEIIDLPGIGLAWILGIVSFIALLLMLVVYLCVRVHKERKLLRELKAAGLENFEYGAVEHINPALSLDEQADLLPYDRNFEFPRNKLKLGKQLGAGAFGVVLKGYAEGIKPNERETEVAVKMVKRTADNEVMRALVSELKIMIHLGQHLNVVNLLGAVTKNIVKKELMVIVEFCRFGNVQNVLMKNRKHFVNQINPETDKIDPTCMFSRFSDSFCHRELYVNMPLNNHEYINDIKTQMNNNYTIKNRSNSEGDPRSGTRAGRPNSSGYVRHSELYEGRVDSCHTVMTTMTEDDNSSQPGWRSNYKPDSNEAMTLTTSDLISWAFQVARGMEYLSSKRVLHGDLAARNILLCEENVVKICDFGLARTMYNSQNYKKQGEAPLPIKWLALESLSDHVFSTYTDVWSFGIVLWEFFSLAKVPYTGMNPNQNLFLKLKDGYRMEKPPFANDELYDIMLECWSANPESRPLFNVLEKRFARMLGDDITNHYMDLNEPYLRSNNDRQGQSTIYIPDPIGSPDEMAPPPPSYVNGRLLPEIRIESTSDDQLNINVENDSVIFSPTRTNEFENTVKVNETSFVFPDSGKQSPTLTNNLDSSSNKNLRKDGIQPEEMPMLQNENAHELDEYEENSKELSNKYSDRPKPTPRNYLAETQLNGDDNYVNVKASPQRIITNINNGRAPDAFSNPSYQALKTFQK